MLLRDFDYDLPEELIAQYPSERRDGSRMLVLDRRRRSWSDRHFTEFPTLLHEGDVVVVNNTRVFPARLIGKRMPSGGRAELLLVRELEPGVWETLPRPARRLAEGSRLMFGQGELGAEILQRANGSLSVVRFETTRPLEAILDKIGQTPLPPYIKRPIGSLDADRERYQTVYAERRGAIAAPTAGLHFTRAVLDEILARGAHIVEITLHVGYGTFEPVRAQDPEKHHAAAEWYEISDSAAQMINLAGSRPGARVVAIGTTTTRALESAVNEEGAVSASAGWATLTIRPGYRFRIIGGLLTNFHLPRSSTLLLVSAFGGVDMLLDAYRYAVDCRYRFYSYGDCMLII